MPCGPQMVRRVLATATHGHAAASGITAHKPCLGEGRVETSNDDRRRVHALLMWLARAGFALLAAVAILAAL